MQTVLGPYGNCQSACLATLLGEPLAAIPNFAELARADPNAFGRAQAEWLAARGLAILTVAKWQSLPWPPQLGYFICAGVSPRGNRHAVIYKDGALWHDPHPDGGGIAEVDEIDIIYPLNPKPEVFPPAEPSELMIQAYRMALRNLIARTPPAARRWKKDGRGYKIPEREKAIARYRAMIEAARVELERA